MQNIEESIEINRPVSAVYNQWTQFEEFPSFMEGVKEVRQLDNKRLHWKAEVAGSEKEWDAEIIDQVPDRRIAWKSTSGAANAGSVEFAPISSSTCRVRLRLDYEPEGTKESLGGALGVVSRKVTGDLKRFKEFIESRDSATGAWRGEIKDGHVAGDPGTTGI